MLSFYALSNKLPLTATIRVRPKLSLFLLPYFMFYIFLCLKYLAHSSLCASTYKRFSYLGYKTCRFFPLLHILACIVYFLPYYIFLTVLYILAFITYYCLYYIHSCLYCIYFYLLTYMLVPYLSHTSCLFCI